MALWNDMTLIMPVADVCAYDLRDSKTLNRMSSLVKILAEAACQVSQKHPMWAEIEIFSNLVRRLRHRIPCDKLLHIFQQISHYLKNLQKVRISTVYLKMADTLLSALKEGGAGIAILPSRQQLEYVLIRTQGVTRLLCQTIDFCFNAFAHLLQRLNLGQCKLGMLMASASLARISLLLKAFLLEMCEIYSNLVKFKDILKAGFWHWNIDPKLPDDLLKWLGPRVEELLRVEDRSQNTLDFLNEIFKADSDNNIEVIDIDDDDDDDDVIIIDNDDDDDVKVLSAENEPDDILVIPEEVDIDLGEVVQRCDVSPSITENDISLPVSKNDDICIPASENDTVIPIEQDNNYKDKIQVQNLIENAKSLKTLRQILKRLHSSQKIEGSRARIKSLKNVKKTLSSLKENILDLKRIRTLTTSKKNKRKKDLVERAKKELIDEIVFLEKTQKKNRTKQKTKEKTKQNGKTSKNSSSHLSLKPVKKFSDFSKLCSYLVSELRKKDKRSSCCRLKKLYRRGCRNAKFLINAGDSVSCKRIIFRYSKKMLAFYEAVNR